MTSNLPHDLLQSPVEQLSYEQAFHQLEEIVGKLESDSQALDLTMALFERGQELAHYCASLLDRAELRVQQLTAEKLSDFS